ncbi:MAG: lamin tail domain-containing protein [Myxococcales bacterium]|nr:lamin tail domain-containing protein [Myxococcales bacterium]
MRYWSRVLALPLVFSLACSAGGESTNPGDEDTDGGGNTDDIFGSDGLDGFEPDAVVGDSDGSFPDTDGGDAADGSDGAADADGADVPALPAVVVVNEIMVEALAGGADWIELVNLGTGNANLAGWGIARGNGAKSILPAVTVPPGGYYVVEAALGFDLQAADGIRLTAPNGDLVEEESWQAGDASPGSTWGRFPNGTGDFKSLATATKGAENVDTGAVPCGDGACAGQESCTNCPSDCATCPICPDGECNGDETCSTCEADCGACPTCGNGQCGGTEDCQSCPGDCGGCVEGCGATLFFAGYVEGSSSNKAFEIMNFTGATVDLSTYEIWRISNGGSWSEGAGNDFPLTGFLGHGESIVVCNTSSQSGVLGVCDVKNGGGPVSFNGDDALGLAKDGVLVDVIGDDSDPSPSGGWTVAGVAKATTDHTLLRKKTILTGTTDWAKSSGNEWVVLEQDELSDFGDHKANGICEPAPVLPNLQVNEILVGASGYVELVNGDPIHDLDASGWTVHVDAVSYALPSGTVILAKGYLALAASGLGVEPAALSAVKLEDAEAALVWEGTVPGDLLAGQSWGRIPDVNGAFLGLDVPTPGAANQPNPSQCGNGNCSNGETCDTCADDCGACPKCSDGTCNGDETCETCPGDCGECPNCGNLACAQSEDCSCESDCGPCTLGCATTLIFSEYLEGTGSNKALEISNRTGKPVDLSQYAVWKLTNGGAFTDGSGISKVTLSGQLAHGDVYVICGDKSVAAIKANCDFKTTGVLSTYNGNDSIALVVGGQVVDRIGADGPDVGTGWDVAGIKAATAEHTLRRKTSVVNGNTDWALSAATEWTVAGADVATGLGSHAALATCEAFVGCGDGSCGDGEDCESCLADCGECPDVCGNGTCGAEENCTLCEDDCGACPDVCGNDVCAESESCAQCEVDCGVCPETCGNNVCADTEESCDTCATDCGVCPAVCGNQDCEAAETCGSCVVDCGECPPGCAADLFFSEYVEGSSQSKALEVANFTGKDVDLSDYEIALGPNGNALVPANGVPLSGTLAHGDVFVFCHSSSATALKTKCDKFSGGTPVSYNGNDAIGLYKNEVLLDVIGVPGEEPTGGWTAGGIAKATADHTLRRLPAVLSGSTTWAPDSWSVFEIDSFDDVGQHTPEAVCEQP